MPNVWTIHHGDVTGGSHKSDLHGCHITTNAAGTAYEFTDNNINTVLATTTGTTLPTVPFTFPSFGLDSLNWTIEVTTLTGGAGGNQAGGNWSNDAPSITADETGTWTAQAGSTVGDDTDADEAEDEDASSASA
ncbi:MAG TPA: hypothetical protein VJ372_15365 [Pyrinomonadaceae bacterium]|jgi:hypothetical protein|nr:hypothetical protein [Pyrinomonadaceae bacterium]